MDISIISYQLGLDANQHGKIIIEGNISCVDDGNGNITITEDN